MAASAVWTRWRRMTGGTTIRYALENMPKNLAIVDAIAIVATRHGVSNAQVTLAWLLPQGNDIVPIPA